MVATKIVTCIASLFFMYCLKNYASILKIKCCLVEKASLSRKKPRASLRRCRTFAPTGCGANMRRYLIHTAHQCFFLRNKVRTCAKDQNLGKINEFYFVSCKLLIFNYLNTFFYLIENILRKNKNFFLKLFADSEKINTFASSN